METIAIAFWGKSRYWWVLSVAGVLLIAAGIWLAAEPAAGYRALSAVLGWILVILGILQLVIAGESIHRVPGWGWWLAGAIFDLLIGIMLISNLIMSEIVLPYIFAFILLYRSTKNIVAGISQYKHQKSWWLYLLNGLILLCASIIFFFVPFMGAYVMLYVCAFVFIYWGIGLIIFSSDLKAKKKTE